MAIANKCNVFVCAIFLLMAVLGCARNEGDTTEPSLSADEDFKDFGTVVTPRELKHVFVLRNSSPQDVQITRVVPSCSCTVANAPAIVRAHSTASLDLTVETLSRRGAFPVSIDVFTDRSSCKPLRLRASFVGRPRNTCDPPEIVIRRSSELPLEVPLKVISTVDVSSGILVPIPRFQDQEGLACAVGEILVAPAENGVRKVTYECTCSVNLSKFQETGERRIVRTLEVTGLPSPTPNLSISVVIEFPDHPFLTGPRSLRVMRSRPESANLIAKIWSTDGRTLRIDRVETSNENITASVVESLEANAFEMAITTASNYWSSITEPAKESIRIYAADAADDPYKIDLYMLR